MLLREMTELTVLVDASGKVFGATSVPNSGFVFATKQDAEDFADKSQVAWTPVRLCKPKETP